MRDGFRIGFGIEKITFSLKLAAQRSEIFDNTIVNERNPARHMRMRVTFCRRAMRCPARMPDTGCARPWNGAGAVPEDLRVFPLRAAAKVHHRLASAMPALS